MGLCVRSKFKYCTEMKLSKSHFGHLASSQGYETCVFVITVDDG